MLAKLRYKLRYYKLLSLCKRLHLQLLGDDKQTESDPIFIIYKTRIQLALILNQRQVRVYVHSTQCIPYVLSYVLVELSKMYSLVVAGYYQNRVDNNTKSVRNLALVKDSNNEPTYH